MLITEDNQCNSGCMNAVIQVSFDNFIPWTVQLGNQSFLSFALTFQNYIDGIIGLGGTLGTPGWLQESFVVVQKVRSRMESNMLRANPPSFNSDSFQLHNKSRE